jgi:Ni2+-binding GTPase involved in maturation of urease and hydrogenase
MSTYTAADIRKMIDELDSQYRTAIIKGDIEVVFKKERAKLVSSFSHRHETYSHR